MALICASRFYAWRSFCFICPVLLTPEFIFEKSSLSTRSRSSHSKSFRSTLSENAFWASYSFSAVFCFFSWLIFFLISSLICSKASRKNCSTSLRWSRITWAKARTFLSSLFFTRRFSRAFMMSSRCSLIIASCWYLTSSFSRSKSPTIWFRLLVSIWILFLYSACFFLIWRSRTSYCSSVPALMLRSRLKLLFSSWRLTISLLIRSI